MVMLDRLVHDPTAIMDGDGDAMKGGKLILQIRALLGWCELRRDADYLLVTALSVDDAGHIMANLFCPFLLRTERKGPSLLASSEIADIGALGDFLGHGVRLGIRLTVTSPFRPCGRPEVGADHSLAQFAAKDLEIMHLVTRGDAVQAILEHLGVQQIGHSTLSIGVVLRAQLPHEIRR